MEFEEFLQVAAGAAGVADGDDGVSQAIISEQQDQLLQLATRNDTDRWSYITERSLTQAESEKLNSEPDTLSDRPRGTIGIYKVDADGVPLIFEFNTHDSPGTLVHLSTEQAEGLAIDLLVKAHALREHTAANRDHSNGGDEK